MPALVRILTWLIRGFVFLFVLLFAMKNTDPLILHFYLGQSWTAPVALVLFIALAIGVLLGLVAGLERIVAQRREILALKRELRLRATDGARRADAAPAPDDTIRPAPDGPLGHS